MTENGSPPGDGAQATAADDISIVEVLDEREPLAESALGLIGGAFEPADRQPLSELTSEIAEKRMGFAADFHLLAALARDGAVLGTVAGIYLEGVNAGFVTYLTVAPEQRGQQLAPDLRSSLVEVFRSDARGAGREDLAWVVGEVRADSNWLRRLAATREAIVFDVDYMRPGTDPAAGDPAYVLYRQPVGDNSSALPVPVMRRLLYAIYRRGYRVRHPLQNIAFRAMLDELDGRETVGEHPDFTTPAAPDARA
jgi:ribosomal protein S18 acetylase RimI-like enzyme